MAEMIGRAAEETPPVAQEDLVFVYRAARTTLIWGFRICAGMLLLGIAVAVARQQRLNDRVDPFGEIVPALRNGNASAIIDLAILAMMVTPAITVLVVAVAFLRAGDRRFAGLSFVVLTILGVSIVLALLR